MDEPGYKPFQSDPVLSIKGLSKHLGRRRILTDINLDVFPGEIFGFLGPNGSGKTTTIKLILGLLSIEKGEISICGHDVEKDFEAAVAGVGGIIENPEMYKYLTGRENLMQYARMCGEVDKARIDEVARIVHLEDRINDKISKYSLGMRQRLGVAQAILHNPKILILDEPTNGLDPAGIKELRDLLLDLAHNEGIAVFISSHLLSELDMLCDRIGIIDNGMLIDTMTIDEVRSAGDGGATGVFFDFDPSTLDKIPDGLRDRINLQENGKHKMMAAKEDIPEIVACLCAAGVRIYSVESAKHSIEEVFLSLTSDYEPDTAAGGDAK